MIGRDLINRVERWFSDHGDDTEFGVHSRDVPYTIIAPATCTARMIFTTKPLSVLAVLSRCQVPDSFGLVGRYGLPSGSDLRWIGGMADSWELAFLGDMDPVDLMTFVWLREGLRPRKVRYVGISDELLKVLGMDPQLLHMLPCSPSELASLPLLQQLMPELSRTIGANCAAILTEGMKIELEAVTNLMSTPAANLLTALVR